jgi:hypothetical protein
MTINDKLHDTIKSSGPIQPKGYVASYCGIILYGVSITWSLQSKDKK